MLRLAGLGGGHARGPAVRRLRGAARGGRRGVGEARRRGPARGVPRASPDRGPGRVAWSRGEQAGVGSADDGDAPRPRGGNREYESRFGHVFLINATGKSADEMLDALTRRLDNDAEAELGEAAEQQRQITRIRLEKLVRPVAAERGGGDDAGRHGHHDARPRHVRRSSGGRRAGRAWRCAAATPGSRSGGATDDDGRLRDLLPDGQARARRSTGCGSTRPRTSRRAACRVLSRGGDRVRGDRCRRAPSRAAPAEPVRLLDVPGELMGFELGANRYGKADIHLATVTRRDDRHDFFERLLDVASRATSTTCTSRATTRPCCRRTRCARRPTRSRSTDPTRSSSGSRSGTPSTCSTRRRPRPGPRCG